MAEETKEEIPEEEEKLDVEKDVIEEIPEEEKAPAVVLETVETWKPKTQLGRAVKNGEIKDVRVILRRGEKIMETQMVDLLLPNLETDLVMVGQSRGKFGGGQRRVFRQTQRKTMEGNDPSFAAYAIVGDRNGLIGLGYGKAKETVPAREKAIRNAKLHIFEIRRGGGSWESTSDEPHSIPFKVTGKCGSVEVTLIPAPKGKGLVCEKEIARILGLAGIKDIWSHTKGQTRHKVNLVKATEHALKQLMTFKLSSQREAELEIINKRE
ncbi:30S ribosomal protein S5 [Candidatus Woesearchaeota archaeon]|nr:30S ribosomal protein S5 [Candidatus Woesearchaeota archaeon]